MIAPLFAVVLGSNIAISVADTIPKFNVEPSCRQTQRESIGAAQDKDACLEAENNARVQIERSWAEFTAADRAPCISISSGWHPTYTELLTCLETARDARKLRGGLPATEDTNVLPR